MAKKELHLVCNAHIDPVWLWEWEEGAAEAIATFRVAADFCEEFPGFIFNHNEVVLYRWVEEYEPALFRRLQRLVRQGKWHIMGGWALQPDCNMPAGESFVRHILVGRQYFREHFGVTPTTAINFDSFGHTRGLVQILAKSGYDSYLCCRPGQGDCQLPGDEFVWVGYDGSEIMVRRVSEGYNHGKHGARPKVEKALQKSGSASADVVLWGVGNHGGGPSRYDLRELRKLMRATKATTIKHSTPEQYFRVLRRQFAALPRYPGGLLRWAVGCYTSMSQLKQGHRRLENELYQTEKMAVTAAAQRRLAYPTAELRDAQWDLLVSEFHDALPGSSIQPVEEAVLRLQHHGLELLSRIKARAFFALAAGQPRALAGEIPILVYNPHPYPVSTLVECEFNLANPNHSGTFTLPQVCRRGRPVPTQVEQELSSLYSMDWRKRVVFRAELAPSQMNRFDCRLREIPCRPPPRLRPRRGQIRFKTRDLDVVINTRTGWLDRYRVRGVDYAGKKLGRLLVLRDSEDPWGMTVHSFRAVEGCFTLLSAEASARFSGVKADTLPAVRVIEDGPVRSVIEAVFRYGDSFACQRYKLPKAGSEIEVETRVQWQEKDRMLKWAVPVRSEPAEFWGQTAYGRERLFANGDECVAQKWVAVVARAAGWALTCVNDGVYGSDFDGRELRMSLLRSGVYAGHPIDPKQWVTQDRYTPRIDQGERVFRFWLNGGKPAARLAAVDREALARNEKPFALSFFPAGGGIRPQPGAQVSGDGILLTAAKQSEDGRATILRLFETTGRARTATVTLPWVPLRRRVKFGAFEIKTLRIETRTGRVRETDLLERETVKAPRKSGHPAGSKAVVFTPAWLQSSEQQRRLAFVRQCRVSALQPPQPITSLSYPEKPASLGMTLRVFSADFLNRHDEFAKSSALGYYACQVCCATAMQLGIMLGYDGPVKVWLDGKELFCDAHGTNPAREDEAVIPVAVKKGEHELLVALDTNQGQAWGIFLRFAALDNAGQRKQTGAWPEVVPAEARHSAAPGTAYVPSEEREGPYLEPGHFETSTLNFPATV